MASLSDKSGKCIEDFFKNQRFVDDSDNIVGLNVVLKRNALILLRIFNLCTNFCIRHVKLCVIYLINMKTISDQKSVLLILLIY